MATFAAVVVLALLQLAAGLHEEACEPAQMPEHGSTMLQTVSKDEAARRDNSSYNTSSRFATSTEYCNQNDNFMGCWDQKPSTTTPCTPSAGTQVCKCPDTLCAIDDLDKTPKTTGRCRNKKVYVAGGERHTNTNGIVGVSGTGEEIYCFDMVKNDQWEQRGLVRTSSNRAESKPKKWYGCHPFWHWTYKNGKCRDRTRYLGESCWRGGECVGSDTSYDEYSTSCYNGKCVPYAWVEQRNECTCAWIGWNFFSIVCTAQGGACGGHPCVLSTGNGKKYCDYAASANW